MKFLARILVLGGYILVYAGVANHGRFATSPWMGVFRDAYGVDSKSSTGAASSSAGASTPPGSPGVRVGTRTNPATGAGSQGAGVVNPKTLRPRNNIGPGSGGTTPP